MKESIHKKSVSLSTECFSNTTNTYWNNKGIDVIPTLTLSRRVLLLLPGGGFCGKFVGVSVLLVFSADCLHGVFIGIAASSAQPSSSPLC